MTNETNDLPATETTIDWTQVGRAFGGASGIAGVVVLFGWQFDVTLMRWVLPGLISMQPATAVCLLIVGGLLAFPRAPRGLHALIGIVAIALPLAHVAEYVFAVPRGIDHLFFPGKVLTQAVLPRHPGRMAEGTAASLLVLSILVLTERLAPKKLALGIYTSVLFIPFVISAMSLLAYLLAVRSARGVVGYTDIALPTAVCILLLSIAALAQRAEISTLRISSQAGSTGQLMRRIVLGALVVPPALSWTTLQAANLNLISSDFRLVLTTVGTMMCLLALAIFSIQRISQSEVRLEEERARAELNEAQMRNIIAKAHQAIVTCDEDGHVVSWNRQAEMIFGWTEE